MAENAMLEIATSTMVNKYNLDETEYAMFKFSEGTKNVTIGMTNGEIPVVVTFPRDFLRFEEMKGWSASKKEDYVRHHLLNDMQLPEAVETDPEWQGIIQIVMDNPRGARNLTEEELREMEIEDGSLTETPVAEEPETESLPIEESPEVVAEPEQEETAEEFEAKVEGKKKPKKKKIGKKAKK